MDRQINLKYEDARPLINEADVLLFRGTGWVSYFISIGSESPYTHVGIASWINGSTQMREPLKHSILECVEFREGKGGRAVNLSRQVAENPGRIDVYRPVKFCSEWIFDEETKTTTLDRREINPRAITNTMRKMTGLPYGWKRIWWLAKHKMVGFRLFTNVEDLLCDTLGEIIYPVCSTATAYSFNSTRYDLIHNKSDQWTEPADIARSARLSYLFTLDP